jgi:hypothetical protein
VAISGSNAGSWRTRETSTVLVVSSERRKRHSVASAAFGQRREEAGERVEERKVNGGGRPGEVDEGALIPSPTCPIAVASGERRGELLSTAAPTRSAGAGRRNRRWAGFGELG